MKIRLPRIAWLQLAGLTSGGILGIALALTLSPGDPPIPTAERAAAGLPQIGPDETSAEFPVYLANLSLPPGDIAIDNQGSLWVPLFTGSDSGHELVRFDYESGNMKTYPLPESPASNLFGFIEVRSDGQIILSYGSVVTRFDPVSEIFISVSLPSADNLDELLLPAEGTWVTDLSLGASDEAYVSRMNISAIAKVDTSSMKVLEQIPVPRDFGPVYGLEATPEGLYITNWIGTEKSGARVALISDGTYQELPGSAAEIFGLGDSVVVAGTDDVLRFTDKSLQVAQKETTVAGSGAIYRVAASDDRVWIAGRDAGVILEFTRSGDLIAEHALPSEVIPGESISCPWGIECEDVVISRTRVEGLAVAPDGTLYFSDGNHNRIGVLHPTLP